MVERCVCCDLPVECCGKAIEEKALKAAANERSQMLVQGWSTSKYSGSCGECGRSFPPGELIRRTSTGWKAECCA